MSPCRTEMAKIIMVGVESGWHAHAQAAQASLEQKAKKHRRLEGKEKSAWGKSVLGRETRQCKGPEQEGCLA